jgi:predicted dehydrogenase
VQLPGLALVSGVRVTAIASGRRANAEAVATEFQIPRVCDDGVELAAAPDVDLVIVSSTPPTHARFAIAALDAGKHVLCEKPMALNAAEAEMMLAVARRRPGMAYIDHELRYEPNRREVRKLIHAGTIGRVQHIELMLKPYLRGDGRPQTSSAPWTWWFDAGQGGGILGAVGSHLIDLCRFWTDSEVAEVGGGVASFVPDREDANGVRRAVTADDFASLVLRLGSGAVATITLSAVAHHGPGHFGQITGSHGTIILTGETQLEIGSPGEPLKDASVSDELWEKTKVNNMWSRSFVRLMQDYVGVLEGRPATGSLATFHDGLAVQRVMDAARAGGRVRLD